MIELLYWPTPNGHKITIFLEETGIPYKISVVNIGQGDQFKPEFLKVSQNNRIPAIIDNEPNFSTSDGKFLLFESGAILVYLAEKYNKFLAMELSTRYQSLQWVFWQMGGLGPMAGQNHHFGTYAPEKIPYAIDRYQKETARLYQVMDNRLADTEYLAGEYSIADMACYPWIVPHERQGQDLNDFPNLLRWFNKIKKRPAVIKAYQKGEGMKTGSTVNESSRKFLFNQGAEILKK